MKKTILMAALMIFAISTFAQPGKASHQNSKTATAHHHHKHKKK